MFGTIVDCKALPRAREQAWCPVTADTKGIARRVFYLEEGWKINPRPYLDSGVGQRVAWAQGHVRLRTSARTARTHTHHDFAE
jgi:hypothetical protein